MHPSSGGRKKTMKSKNATAPRSGAKRGFPLPMKALSRIINTMTGGGKKTKSKNVTAPRKQLVG